MKSVNEVMEYLENHFFKNRRHAYAIRNIIIEIDEFKGAEFNFKWANETLKGCFSDTTIRQLTLNRRLVMAVLRDMMPMLWVRRWTLSHLSSL